MCRHTRLPQAQSVSGTKSPRPEHLGWVSLGQPQHCVCPARPEGPRGLEELGRPGAGLEGPVWERWARAICAGGWLQAAGPVSVQAGSGPGEVQGAWGAG